MKTIEYRVRPVTRYVVTEFFSEEGGPSGVRTFKEFEREDDANRVADALFGLAVQEARGDVTVIGRDGMASAMCGAELATPEDFRDALA